MAEIKNTFLKSKMNKDLDDRLIPNGEYRDAQNISVGKSEDADVGALENIIGNSSVTENLPAGYDSTCEIIGYFSDSTNNKIITFVTNYKDPNPSSPTYLSVANTYSPSDGFPLAGNYQSHICIYDQDNPSYSIIVSGDFLNFSTTNKVLGVSLIENLLFFTDNRNQPRKININSAINNSNYYNTEDTISVAKYNPYEAISLLKKVNKKTTSATTSSSTVNIENTDNVEVGMIVVAKNLDGTIAIEGSNFVTVDSKTSNTVTLSTQVGGTTTLVPYNATISDNATITFLKSTMTKEDPANGWPGDPDLLEDKYVRFSYRFKFDDGEYSLMAPFTQIAYVPKQKGYFQEGDEETAYKSTILDFMENNMNNMELLIPLPSRGVDIESQYKITSIDVLYKESDSLVVKVLESLPIGSIPTSNLETNIYSYQYQSRKPYKTLPQSETTRVYDKVPVRALSQETSGNRVIYGNFYDRYSSPESIDYYVGAFAKNTNNFDSWVEYPNHSIKQNRNYQVGFVLVDKFGRQTPVILSPIDLTGIDTGTSEFKGGSTIYRPYYDGSNQPDIKQWFGDAIKVVVQNKISNGVNDTNSLNQAGLYAIQYQDPSKTGIGFSISSATLTNEQKELTIVLDSSHPDNASLPRVGDYLRGQYRDYVKVTNVSSNPIVITADEAISDNYLHKDNLSNDIKFAYTINQVGWYSYKIVVKQTEQEYYNVYSTGVMKGLPFNYDTNKLIPIENQDVSYMPLLNDNINKVPRDLKEVGPQDKTFRSSVQLYGRVQNHNGSNSQFFPGRGSFTTSSIEDLFGLFDVYEFKGDLNTSIPITSPLNAFHGFFKSDSDPFIAEFSTSSDPNLQFGVNNSVLTETGSASASANVTNSITLPVNTATGTIEIGSIITSINSVPVTGSVDYVVVNTTGNSAPILTLNREITLSNNDALQFSLKTYNDIATLAVLETPPVESLLDIFWETTTTGLISDLNEDVLTGSDSPVGITPTGFLFKENQDPNGTGTTTGASDSPYVTDYFYPLSPEGLSLTNTTNPILTVTDNESPANTLGFFTIEQETNAGPNFGAYRVKINNSYYTYFSNSFNTTDTYNFSLTITDVDGNVISIPFTGSLTNIEPFISSTTPPTLTPSPQVLPLLTTPFYEALDPNASFSIGNVGLPANGSLSTSQFGQQTGVFLHSVPPPTTAFGIPFSSILINSQSGDISWGTLKLEGYYDSQVKVKDALISYQTTGGISSQGTESAGSLTSIIYDQPIRVVPAACNLSTSCQISDSIGGQRGQVFQQSNANESSFGWRFGSTSGGVPPGFTQTSTNVQNISTDGLVSGTVLFDLMVQVNKTSGVNCKGLFRWRIWRRANSSSAWSTQGVVSTNAVDLNSNNGTVGLGTGWIADGSARFSCTNTNLNTTSQIHIPIALSQKGEYFIECRGYRIGTGVAECWINASDANYPTCVPVKSTNLISGTGRDADYFEYSLTTGSSSAVSGACAFGLNQTVYARTPYSHVIEQIFTDTTLETGKGGQNTVYYHSYKYEPDTFTTNGTDIALQYAAVFKDVVDDPNDGRTRRGFIDPLQGSGTGSLKRSPCSTSGTYQNLRYRVYYNEDY